MKHTPDEIIERFSRLTHSPRDPYASGDEIYRELLSRLPENDRPVVGSDVQIGRKRKWSTAASIALVAGVGIAIAGVYTFRHELFPITEPETIENPVPVNRIQTLVFDNVPLSEIVVSLSQAYGVEINIASGELENYCLTATISTEEVLDEVLDALCEVGGFSYEIKGNVYIIQK